MIRQHLILLAGRWLAMERLTLSRANYHVILCCYFSVHHQMCWL